MMANLNIKLDLYKNNQVIRYASFDIPEDLIKETFDKIAKKINDPSLIIEEHDKVIQKYIIHEINNGNINLLNNVIDNFCSVKTIIVKNPRYAYSKDVIEKIYLKSINLLRYKYNEKDNISINILNNMKYIINNNYINTKISSMDLQIYDISFLDEYIKLFSIKVDVLANDLNIDVDKLNMLISGEEKANIDLLESLCIYFDVNDYEELKEKINKDIEFNKNNIIDDIRKKLKEIPKKESSKDYIIRNNEKCYNLKFMNEYVNLYNIKKEQLAVLFNCGIKKVDEVLNGKIWIKESLMTDLYIEYRVKNFLELKAKILKMVKVKKFNILKYKIKVYYDEYKKKHVTKDKIIENMNKNMLYEILDLDSKSILDKSIIILLFKLEFEREFSYYEISKILNVDCDYVKKIHDESIDTINEIIDESKTVKVLKKTSN